MGSSTDEGGSRVFMRSIEGVQRGGGGGTAARKEHLWRRVSKPPPCSVKKPRDERGLHSDAAGGWREALGVLSGG